MDTESGSRARGFQSQKSYKTTLCLAYQSFGVVYGDLSICPIYVFSSTFSGRLKLHEHDDTVLGVLSLVFWTLTLIPLIKYTIFVLGADDNGEGGTFALYSLLCRHLKISPLNTADAMHDHISACNMVTSSRETKISSRMKDFFEKHSSSRIVLLLVALLGTSMLIGDGVLTPTMSVLSAVSGIHVKAPGLNEDCTVFVACVILIGLFALQHYGTHRVGFLFAPILIAWLLCISGIGIYNIIKWNPRIIKALSPYYAYDFFKKAGKDGWRSLGGIVLCITGAEAMFADLGHFSQLSIRIAFTGVVYPCLVIAYMGEAAYLSEHKGDLHRSFYRAIPDTVFWPVFVIATLATVVGSQAIISATYSIISQCCALRCFPRVKIIHTSSQVHGQIYIPEVNWILMVLCIIVTIGFRDTYMIGNAYGLAVIIVMFVTTCLMFLVIITVWKKTTLMAILFVTVFGSLELLYLSACLVKVPKRGWLPLFLSFIILSVMSIWHYGTKLKEGFELQNKIRMERLLSLGPNLGIVRIPGIGLIYTNVVSGVPPMFAHFVTNFPAFHRILIFVTSQSLTVPKVCSSEQFLVGRIGPPKYCLFRCIIRYGYKDARPDCHDFENQLIDKVAEFLQHEEEGGNGGAQGQTSLIEIPPMPVVRHENNTGIAQRKKVGFRGVDTRERVRELMEAKEAGVAYMMGHTCVVANDSSSFMRKVAIDLVYGFLRRNCRRPAIALGIPHTSLIEVGMVYRV